MKALISILIILGSVKMIAQENLLEKLLIENQREFYEVLSNIEKYEIQIVYTQIDRDSENLPYFTTYKFNVDPNKYYYPASTVKLPACILSLDKLNSFNNDINKFTKLRIDSSFTGQTSVKFDNTAEFGYPTIAHYIHKILLVSDNDAFNRLYEFLGQKYLNEKLWERGIDDVKLVHRLSIERTEEANKHTNPFFFYDGEKLLYEKPAEFNPVDYNQKFNLSNLIKGKGYIADGKLVNKPKDFSNLNYISLESQTELLKLVLFPEAFEPSQRFNLKEDDYKFLYKQMSMLPRESKFPVYPEINYPDGYVKFFMFGDSKNRIPDNIRIFSKSGLAYGYLTDIAYIVDFENKIEFMLSATIHVNDNQIFNDDNYEYDEIGLPFLSKLGWLIYSNELKRERQVEPDLSKFKFDYTK